MIFFKISHGRNDLAHEKSVSGWIFQTLTKEHSQVIASIQVLTFLAGKAHDVHKISIRVRVHFQKDKRNKDYWR